MNPKKPKISFTIEDIANMGEEDGQELAEEMRDGAASIAELLPEVSHLPFNDQTKAVIQCELPVLVMALQSIADAVSNIDKAIKADDVKPG